MIRKALYSGSFYDNNHERLRYHFDKWFRDIEFNEFDATRNIVGLICPHAGYMYSGYCAAHSFKTLLNKNIKNVIIIHPSHRSISFGISVSPYPEYETPLGNLFLNQDIANSLILKGSEIIDVSFHQNEHSMEVQLPFIHYLNPSIKIVPIMIGNQNRQVTQTLAKLLFEYINEETVIIVSSDLSHYRSAEEATIMDRLLINDIINLDTDNFYNNIYTSKTEACGFAGILTLMNLAKMIDKPVFTELLYTHSGITSGDYEQVVGYLSATLTKG